MKTQLTLLLLFLSGTMLAQNYDPWKIQAKDIDPNNYYGITVANGVVGLVSSAEPMKVADVVLNGVYDNYQRGRVSNILKTFNHVNMDLDVDGRRIDRKNISNYQQSLNMETATLETTFDVEDKLSVKHQILSLRHLPFTSLVIVELTAKKAVQVVPIAKIEAPNHLREVKNTYSEIDRPHVLIPLMSSEAGSPSGQFKVASSNSFIFPEKHGSEPKVIHEDWDYNMHLAKFYKNLKAGETYRFALVASTMSSQQYTDPLNEAERLTIFARLEGTERLLMKHKQAWKKLWEKDIIIEGDPQNSARSAECIVSFIFFRTCRDGKQPLAHGFVWIGLQRTYLLGY